MNASAADKILLRKFREHAVIKFDVNWVVSQLLDPALGGTLLYRLLLESLMAWTVNPQSKSFRVASMNATIFTEIHKNTANTKSERGSDGFEAACNNYIPYFYALGRFFPRSVRSTIEMSQLFDRYAASAQYLLPLIGLMQIHQNLQTNKKRASNFSDVSFEKANNAALALMSKEDNTYINADILERIPPILWPSNRKYMQESWNHNKTSAAIIAAFFCWGNRHGMGGMDITELFDQLRASKQQALELKEIVQLARYFDEQIVEKARLNSKLKQSNKTNFTKRYPEDIAPIVHPIYDTNLNLMELLELQFVDNRKKLKG